MTAETVCDAAFTQNIDPKISFRQQVIPMGGIVKSLLSSRLDTGAGGEGGSWDLLARQLLTDFMNFGAK